MKKLLTLAVVVTLVVTAGLPTVAQAQHRGVPRGNLRCMPPPPPAYHGGHPGGHGGGCGWSTGGALLAGVVIGSILQNACYAEPPCRPVVYAQPAYWPMPVCYTPPVRYVQHAPPVQYVQPQAVVVQQVPSVVTVWVQNSNGSRSPVQLRTTGGGAYVGPRGEYYTGLPTNEQLRQFYGM